MIITLSGDDNSKLSARLHSLLAEYLTGDAAAFNLTEMNGSEVSVDDLRAACDSVPFLGGHRVIVVRGLLGRFSDKEADGSAAKAAAAAFLKDLKAYLSRVPESTVLIFVERRKLGAGAAANLLRSATESEDCSLPDAKDMPRYVQKLVGARGATIDRDATALLAAAIAEDPPRLEPELQKLLAYRAEERHISVRDVRDLVHIPIEVAVWDLTDSLFRHDATASLKALRALLERGQPPQQVMGAVASQFRNLVVAEEHKGSPPDRLTAATGMKPFVARKSLAALRNLKPGEPRRVLAALMELDLRVKTGKAEINSALELLIVEVCARRL